MSDLLDLETLLAWYLVGLQSVLYAVPVDPKRCKSDFSRSRMRVDRGVFRARNK